MTAGAFRIADDFPAIAKQQRIIQLTDENPLFVVDLAKDTEENPYRMRLADAGADLHAGDMADMVKAAEENLLRIYSHWDMSPEQRAAADKMRLAENFCRYAAKIDPDGPPVFVGMDMGKEIDLCAVSLEVAPEMWPPPSGFTSDGEPPERRNIPDLVREQMRADKRAYEERINSHCKLRALTLKIDCAITTTHRNSPKCLGVDVLLDIASYNLFVGDLRHRAARYSNPMVATTYLGARIMMYDCDTELLEARPRWR